MKSNIRKAGAHPSQRWATPWDFFAGVNQRYKFNLDVCAEPWSAKCPDYYTIEDDGLAQSWHDIVPTRVWCNPPYANVRPWLEKGIDTILEHDGTCVYLLPVSTSTRAFHELIFGKAHIGFVDGRMGFTKPADIDSDEPGPNFDSMLVTYNLEVLRGLTAPSVYRLDQQGREIESDRIMVQRSLW